MNAPKESMQKAGYRYVKSLGYTQHVLERLDDKTQEVWFSNKNHASYGIKWRNTHLEFARGYKGE